MDSKTSKEACPLAIDSTVQNKAKARHLLSYLIISIVPIVLCSVLLICGSYARRTEQADENARTSLNLFSNTYRTLCSSMDACAGHLEDNLNSFGEHKATVLPAQLKSYQQNYSLFTMVLYYEKGSGLIYTPDGYIPYIDLERYFQAILNVDLTMTNFFLNINSATSNLALRSRAANAEHENSEYIFYIRPMPALSARPTGVMVFCVSAKSLLTLLDEFSPAQYAFYTYANRYLSYLYQSDYSRVGTYLSDALTHLGAAGMSKNDVAGSSYLLLRVRSETDDMYHMIAYDCDTLYAPYRAEMTRSLMTLLFLLLPVGLTAYILHRRTYTPMDMLFNLSLPEGDIPIDNASPEKLLGSVADRAQLMIRENELLQEQVEDQKAELCAQAVTSILFGEAEKSPFSAVPELPHPYCTALYALIPPMPQEAFLPGGMIESIGADCVFYAVPLRTSGQLAILANHRTPEREPMTRIVLSELARRGVQPLRFGVGLSQRQIERMNVSFVQAQAVLQKEADHTGALFYSADEEAHSIVGFLPASSRLLLEQCIRGGNREIALSTLHRMHSDILPLCADRSVAGCWRIFLYETICNALKESHLEELLTSMTAEDVLYVSMDEFMQRMEEIVSAACMRISKQGEDLLREKNASLVQYVDEHFRDLDLSLSLLSQRFDFSESYITRYFKTHIHMSFLQYISQKRMDFVKEQLSTTDRPIKEIVCDAGYRDIPNFTRKFRQIVGMTPGQFRTCQHEGSLDNAE